MADKLTPLILTALSRAAAAPDGLPLFASKYEDGLFPGNASGKPAAKKAIDDGLLRIDRTEHHGKRKVEFCTATELGRDFLLEKHSPKQVLEDFVRVLEQRHDEVRELLTSAARMAVGLERLTEVVTGVLPKVAQSRLPNVHYTEESPEFTSRPGTLAEPTDERPMPKILPLPERTAVAELDPQADLAEAILARLADWSASEASSRDCPLPDLYRSLSVREEPPTIGEFHDCLRELEKNRKLRLHPWTGPLYTMPEPQLALLIGHQVSYYAAQG